MPFLLPTGDGEPVEVLSFSDERYVVEGGVGMLPEAMAAALGDHVQLDRVLNRVDAMTSTYKLTFVDGEVVEADYVVIAIAVSLLRTIDWAVTLPAQFRRYIRDVDLGHNEKTFAGFDPQVWRTPDGFINGL